MLLMFNLTSLDSLAMESVVFSSDRTSVWFLVCNNKPSFFSPVVTLTREFWSFLASSQDPLTHTTASAFHWATKAQSSLRSTAYSSPPLEFAVMFLTRGHTCHWSPKCYFASLCWQYCDFCSCFCLFNMWRKDQNTHSLQLKVLHVLVETTIQSVLQWHCYQKFFSHCIHFWCSFLEF